MKVLRLLTLLCALVAVLPWGAVVAHADMRARTAPAAAAPVPLAPTRIVLKSDCPVRALPGTACGADILQVTSVEAGLRPVADTPAVPSATRQPGGLSPVPDLTPPRIG